MPFVEVTLPSTAASEWDHFLSKGVTENVAPTAGELTFGLSSKSSVTPIAMFVAFGPLDIPAEATIRYSQVTYTHSATSTTVPQTWRAVNTTVADGDGIWEHWARESTYGKESSDICIQAQLFTEDSTELGASDPDETLPDSGTYGGPANRLNVSTKLSMMQTVKCSAGIIDKLGFAFQRNNGSRPGETVGIELWSLDENSPTGQPVAKLAETAGIPFDSIVPQWSGGFATTASTLEALLNPTVADLVTPYEVEEDDTWFGVIGGRATWSGTGNPRLAVGWVQSDLMDRQVCVDGNTFRNIIDLSTRSGFVPQNYLYRRMMPFFSTNLDTDTARTPPRHFGDVVFNNIHENHVLDQTETYGDASTNSDHTLNLAPLITRWIKTDAYAAANGIVFVFDPTNIQGALTWSVWSYDHGSKSPSLVIGYTTSHKISAYGELAERVRSEGAITERVNSPAAGLAERVVAGDGDRLAARVRVPAACIAERVRCEEAGVY